MLNNWRKHKVDRAVSWKVDPYSSGTAFRGWKAFEDPRFAFVTPAAYEPMIVWEPKTWLLREGWRMYGRIDFYEVPSSPKRKLTKRTSNLATRGFAEG